MVAKLLVDIQKRKAELNGASLGLRRREFDLLAYLYLNFGRICTKDELRRDLYGDDAERLASGRAVDQTVKRLRKKLDGGPKIRTEWGVGYWLDYNPEVDARQPD